MNMNQSDSSLPEDGKLDALLGKWHGITPSPDFNEQVWRRLESAIPQINEKRPIFTWVRERLKPLDAVAALAGLAAGLMISLQILSHDVAQSDYRFQILHSSGVAGGYMELASRGLK